MNLGPLTYQTDTLACTATTNCYISVENLINLTKFYCKNNGVLYENETIQIGVKTECRANLAGMALFYGNKTSFPFIVSA